MIRYLLTEHKRKLLAGVVVVAMLAAFVIVAVAVREHRTSALNRPHDQTSRDGGSEAGSATGAGYNALSEQELALLDTAPDISPATTASLPPIPAGERTQPDLYARAFFTALFSHPYAGVTRDQLLAWIQTQQAESPFITGGTHAERARLLVESATNPGWSDNGYAAVPDTAGWQQAVAGHSHVHLGRITCITPPDWEAALAAGDITDPGLTARQVSADLTMTWTAGGHARTQRFSAALTLLLEGPPTIDQYGVVVIADTNVVQGGGS